MARSIGDFGTEHEPIEALDFGYFGERIRVHPDAGELTYLDFMAKAMEVDETDEAEGVRLTMSFLKQQVHPEDWDLFWAKAMGNRQRLADLMLISRAIVEATAGFPTEPSSDSPDTPSTMPTKSKAASSRRGKTRAIESAKPIDDWTSDEVATAALAQLGGRPDLQRAVAMANGQAAL